VQGRRIEGVAEIRNLNLESKPVYDLQEIKDIDTLELEWKDNGTDQRLTLMLTFLLCLRILPLTLHISSQSSEIASTCSSQSLLLSAPRSNT
jgi:hypothetical protein